MKQLILFFILICFAFNLEAQLKNTDDQAPLNIKLDVRARIGGSIPLGKYQLLTSESDDRSAAGLGVYHEIMASITPLSSSPWRLAAILGYNYNPFKDEASRKQYKLSLFDSNDWNSFYGIIGIGFISETKFLYGIQAGAGVLGYTGGNITLGHNHLDTMQVKTWRYPLSLSGVVRVSLLAGYQITPKFSMFASAALIYAAGVREGNLTESSYLTNAQNVLQQPALEENNSMEQNQTTIFTLNIGLGFRYKFYKRTNTFHYKFNIE